MEVTHSSLATAVEELFHRLPCASREQAAESLRGLSGRDGYVPKLQSWLELNRSAFREPIAAENLDGLQDRGIDVLLRGLRSQARVGFQVKSDNDLRAKTFTRDLRAQLFQASGLVDLMIVVFACNPTKRNQAIVNGWLNSSLASQKILCLPPERAASLLEHLDRPLAPSSQPPCSWVGFFRAIDQPHLRYTYLDAWPGLEPDRRFLLPEVFPKIRSALEEHRLVFVIGPPATGKTFTALQLLWEAYCVGRPVSWVTANDENSTEGLIPRDRLGAGERLELKRRIETLLRNLGAQPGRWPADELDVVSRLLVPEALVYVEDPFGRTEDAYDLSLASYDFFDFQRLVEVLKKGNNILDSPAYP